ncbi:TIMELESS-interacting protein-like isoform X2 [Phyllopteryx taeniolatus]|uniref:TIMELESS-interacting protein-like isoform X2 n=1 Tax=Phyllopteryx taeniolatus TaxID=161469 RepID=UPI002AD3E68A|nr:TIMELESS-interacting protein-like isoform X2 [Phyllopteryx taeniolatus]
MVKMLQNDSVEMFSPFPPPLSPGQGGGPFGNDEEAGEVSKLAEVPAAKRKGVKRPQPKLDPHRLTSEKGLPALRTLFDDVCFKGKGHEAEDVQLLMQKMENWAHRLYPKLQFEDFIDKVEKLGAKKEVQTCLKRIRLDMPLIHEDFTGIGEEEAPSVFDILGDSDPFSSQSFPSDPQEPIHSTPAPTSTPAPSITDEQHQRMELNRQQGLERRKACQQQQQLTGLQPVDPSLQAGESSLNTSKYVSHSKGEDDEELDSSCPQLSVKTPESAAMLCEKAGTKPNPLASSSTEALEQINAE